MADPLSITASIITLIQASIQVTVLIKQFRNEASAVDATLTGLLGDVERFKRVLESMKETVDQSDIKSNLKSTGHTGNHWKNLARSLNDGTDTLQKLHDLLDGINKKTSVLDTPRKLLRLKSASEQIAHYREQIQSSHTALQLSLSTIILWNQVASQKSTEMIPDKIVPTLDKLYDEFRTFGALINAKIEKLQLAAIEPTDLDNDKLQYMNNLRECVRSAADVVSSASTTLNADSSDKASVRYGSDFGDIFIRDANEPMLRWFASNTVYEYEDVETPLPAPSEASTGDAPMEDNSDTDSDLESDLIRSLFKEGKKRKEQGDLTGAVRHFRNCLARFSSKTSYASLTAAQSLTACGVSKADLLEYLTDSYCLLGSWGKAKSTMAEKLVIIERQVGKRDVVYLKDTMKLAEIMMMNQDYVEAHLQARRSLGGFKKLGENGQASYENCLAFLIQMCQLEGKEDEEEAYIALLVGHVKGALRAVPGYQSAILSPDAVQPQPPSDSTSQMDNKMGSVSDVIMGKNTAYPIPVSSGRGQSQLSFPMAEDFDTWLFSQFNPRGASLTPDAQAESIFGTSALDLSQEVLLQSHETTQKNLTQDDPHAASSSLSHRPSGTDQDTKSKTKRIPNVNPIAMEVLKNVAAQMSEHQDGGSKTKELNAPTTLLPASGMAEESEETNSVEYLEEDEKGVSWDRATQSAIYPPSMTASTSTAVDKFGDVQDNKYYSPLSSFIDGRSYPIELMKFISMLSRSSREDKIKRQRQEAKANIDFLETYCRLKYGTGPDYFSSGGLAGFTCTVSINNQQLCTVSGYASRSQAIDAAAAKVCWEYMTTAEMVMVMETLGKPNRSSDKEVYVPYSDDSHIAISDDTPLQQAPGVFDLEDWGILHWINCRDHTA